MKMKVVVVIDSLKGSLFLNMGQAIKEAAQVVYPEGRCGCSPTADGGMKRSKH